MSKAKATGKGKGGDVRATLAGLTWAKFVGGGGFVDVKPRNGGFVGMPIKGDPAPDGDDRDAWQEAATKLENVVLAGIGRTLGKGSMDVDVTDDGLVHIKPAAKPKGKPRKAPAKKSPAKKTADKDPAPNPNGVDMDQRIANAVDLQEQRWHAKGKTRANLTRTINALRKGLTKDQSEALDAALKAKTAELANATPKQERAKGHVTCDGCGDLHPRKSLETCAECGKRFCGLCMSATEGTKDKCRNCTGEVQVQDGRAGKPAPEGPSEAEVAVLKEMVEVALDLHGQAKPNGSATDAPWAEHVDLAKLGATTGRLAKLMQKAVRTLAVRRTRRTRRSGTGGGGGKGTGSGYGWTRDAEGNPVPEAREQVMIRRAQQLQGEGLSVGRIGKALLEEGFTPRSGQQWYYNNTKSLLNARLADTPADDGEA